MKELNLYKIVGKDNKEIMCLSVKNLLEHLRELDVVALRDEKTILATLMGECLESLGMIELPKGIEARTPQREVAEPKPMNKPMQKRSSNVGSPEIDEEDIPRPVKKKPAFDIRADDEGEEVEGDDEAEVEEENDEESFQLR